MTVPGADTAKYTVSEEAFFAAGATTDAITTLANSKALAIYLGAGCSIDYTGQSWSSLIEGLMRSKQLNHKDLPDSRIAIAKQELLPLEAATVLKELTVKRLGKQTYRDIIATEIATRLESSDRWNSGELLYTVMQFASRVARAGGDVRLVTTNYDTFIERVRDSAKERSTEIFPPLVIKVQGELVGPARNSTKSKITLEYLHGRVAANTRTVGKVAFAEDDYVELRDKVAKLLLDSFQDRDILVLGSSLTDPPLLNALLSQRSSGTHRLALFPVPSFEMKHSARQDIEDRKSLAKTRAQAFGFDILFPDFYSQAPQFMRELCVEFDKPFMPPSDYFSRLRIWWELWHQQVEPPSTDAHTQAGAADKIAQRELSNCVERIRGHLAGTHSPSTIKEVLKLELWVRWDPGPDSNRGLKLWATSTTILAAKDSMRFSPLDLDTEHAAVSVFQSGRPEHFCIDKQDSKLGNHWQTFLSCPIVEEDKRVRFPVGAITLASQSSSSDPHEKTRVQDQRD